jgi:hypothetical protein
MASLEKISIYSFYYKPTVIPVQNNLYIPVMAGNVLLKTSTGMQGDDIHDSISDKNRFYSELTGIYWVWKNTRQEVTGCCHYRRYFTAVQEPFGSRLKRILYFAAGLYRKRFGLIYTSNIERFKNRIINEKEVREILQNYDAILPQKRKLKYTVKVHYSRYHNIKDLEILEAILTDKHPEYVSAFKNVMEGKRLYANNMFIMRDNHFQQFMSWWFDILFEYEKRVNLSDYRDYQQRIMGFLGERLLTIWFSHENLKVKELQVIYFKKLKNKGDKSLQ